MEFLKNQGYNSKALFYKEKYSVYQKPKIFYIKFQTLFESNSKKKSRVLKKIKFVKNQLFSKILKSVNQIPNSKALNFVPTFGRFPSLFIFIVAIFIVENFPAIFDYEIVHRKVDFLNGKIPVRASATIQSLSSWRFRTRFSYSFSSTTSKTGSSESAKN
uniref:Uncharacterized protein n=1 Tax=Romanomermis culicivorax TaxID=13658 RepID=A0A915IYF3_ROMCU